MAFQQGLYAIRFQTPVGAGAGVAYLTDGSLRGGDGMMAYVGTYREADGNLEADVLSYVHTNTPGMESVFGVNRVNIHLAGKVDGGKGTLIGTAPEAPGVKLQVSLERLSD